MKSTASKGKIHIDQLGSTERSKQLSIIDRLREHGVGDDISLPQARAISIVRGI